MGAPPAFLSDSNPMRIGSTIDWSIIQSFFAGLKKHASRYEEDLAFAWRISNILRDQYASEPPRPAGRTGVVAGIAMRLRRRPGWFRCRRRRRRRWDRKVPPRGRTQMRRARWKYQ